ncbi:MAG: acyltransferase, partial [Flavobacteriaceae bacterium]|nr:acyltransferase [Flavobacteriaceae bacterium]
VNSFIPYLLYKKFEPRIKEPEFISTTKFAIGASAFPLFYILQSLAVVHFFGMQAGLLYLAASLVLALLVVKTK